jgi:hypothetical protein
MLVLSRKEYDELPRALIVDVICNAPTSNARTRSPCFTGKELKETLDHFSKWWRDRHRKRYIKSIRSAAKLFASVLAYSVTLDCKRDLAELETFTSAIDELSTTRLYAELQGAMNAELPGFMIPGHASFEPPAVVSNATGKSDIFSGELPS